MIKRPSKWRLVFNGVMVLLALGILYQTLGPSYKQILRQLLLSGKQGALLLIFLEILYLSLDGNILGLMLRHVNKKYRCYQGIRIILYGNFYKGITFGGGTTLAQIYLLSKQGIHPGIASGVLTLQYAFHRVAILLSSLILLGITYPYSIVWLKENRYYVYLGIGVNAFIILGLLMLCIGKECHQFVLGLIQSVLRKGHKEDRSVKIKIFLKDLREVTQFFFKKPYWCGKIILLNMLKVCCWYAIPYVAYWSIKETLPSGRALIEVMMLTSLMQLLIGIIPAPVGIGSTEVVYMMIFGKIFGVLAAKTSMILFRLMTYYFPFLISIIYMIIK